jgi:hypothetical protein
MVKQKQIDKLRFPDLAALTASGLTSPDVAYIVSENAFYTRVGGVNTKVNPGQANLTLANRNSATLDIQSDGGTDVTIPAVTTSLAGLATATDKTNIEALITKSGVAAGATNNGTFTGATIPDNVTVKAALQALETAVELRAVDADALHKAGAETITGIKTFTAQPSGIAAASIVNTPAGNIAATTVQAALNELDTEKQSVSEKGQANGYASLDSGGKVPASQLPSYVDDIIEVATVAALPATGETGKIYLITTGAEIDRQYRWTGTVYSWINQPSGAPVTSVFTRTGAITATAGDYNATQITNTPSGNIAATTVQAALNELDNEKQAKIQFQDEGVAQGTSGAATTINFTGAGVSVGVSGSTATVTVTKGFTEQLVQITPTGTNTLPTLSPVPSDPARVKIFVNAVFVPNNAITVNSSGVFTVTPVTLGYSIDATDIVTCEYIS